MHIVYDASAKTSRSQLSLNEALYRGPVLATNLIGLLLRFQSHRIAITSDIEKAFLQVGLRERDRDATPFLWLKTTQSTSLTDNVQAYRFTRLPFGLICSPFLLAATDRHHLATAGTPTAQFIQDNIYVDNVIGGAPTTPDAV